jgi:class 3 adenylate cyclase/tetratricopeptide (TPR) repeat protein
MVCPACRAETRPGTRFCEECGARLELACPACGAAIPADKKFCGACGTPLGARASGPAAAPGRRPAQAREPAARPGPGPIRDVSPAAYTPAHLAERILKDRSALAGERKQVTVLFADASGFTSMSEQLDPEDVHEIINRAFELMLAEIHRYEGTVNQFLGDGLMALFGAPIAHEDHARRAAHAALGVRGALARYRQDLLAARGIDFRVRLGLNTGLVVVGAIGDNLRMDYTAVGDTTNTAARMLDLAEPGQIAVAEATERLIGAYFEMRQLGTFTVKNRAQPLAAYELGPARARVSRLAARAVQGLSPFVGRGDALATLERASSSARAGRGQAVFVVGDAGIGKSRLLLEFRERVTREVTWLEGDCISFGQATPFFPVIELLKQEFDIDDRDGEPEVVAKIESGVAALGDEARELLPYVRYLLSADPGDPAVGSMDPGTRRARIVDALRRLTGAAARHRPVVFTIEDAHWMDSASEEFLKSLAESLPGMAVLLVVTYRPLYEPPFGDRTYYWRVPLQPVDEAGAVRIVRSALGVDDLPWDLTSLIARKAEGNPFFLEEIGRTLVETGAVRVEAGRLVTTRAASAIAVPDTVQDLIAARLDRLGEPQKRTVQTASVIGREFGLDLLRRVSDVQEQLERALGDLQRIELIYEKAGYGNAEYVFRHALTQDVAYTSLLQAERKRLHTLIGSAIEEVYAGRLDEHAEELVHHFTRGEVSERVARYARDAGDRAAALCADDRAVELYDLALGALARLPETPETARAGIDLRLAMRVPLWRAGRAERLFALFKEAEDLAKRFGATAQLDRIYAFLVQYFWAKGDQDRALDYGRRCLEAAEARGDLGLRVTGLFYIAHAFLALGRHREGLERAREILALLDGPPAMERFGLSGLPYSGACAIGASCLVEIGDHAGALALLERGRAVADASRHLYSQAVIAIVEGEVLARMGRPHDAIGVLESAADTSREKNFYGQLINALRHLALAYVLAGRAGDGVSAAREAIEMQERANVSVYRTQKLALLAAAHLALGELDRAEQALAQAFEFAAKNGERGLEGWARVTAAELALARDDRDGAEQQLDAAQEIAEELEMAPLVARCRALARPRA